jgi:hypothetical protein
MRIFGTKNRRFGARIAAAAAEGAISANPESIHVQNK